MRQKYLYLLIIICVIILVIVFICRDKIFGRAVECTSKKILPTQQIVKLSQVNFSNFDKSLKTSGKVEKTNYRTFNPSVTTINDKLLFTYRISNLTKCKSLPNQACHRSTFDKSIIKNHMVLQIGQDKFINIKTKNVSSDGCVQGFEDPRPLSSPDGKTLYLIANNHSKGSRSEMWLIKIPVDRLMSREVSEKGEYFAKDMVRLQLQKERPGNQKNWMPFFLEEGTDGSIKSNLALASSSLMLVYSVNPHIILRCNLTTGICENFAETFNSKLPTDIRGGSQIRYYSGRYIGLTHVRRNSECYVTQAYSFSDKYPFEVTAITLPFVFDDQKDRESASIQFVSGFEIINDVAYITYGEQDCDAKM